MTGTSVPQTRDGRKLTVRRDTIDFRDRMYVPTLIQVPAARPLEVYRSLGLPVLDQHQEGACTGFGLAAVVHALLRLRDGAMDEADQVSPHMLYDLARRYDEWPGDQYEGSSARGAMKGWQKHGVCSRDLYEGSASMSAVTLDALQRPLGAYFRVNHKDIVALHSAMTEAGVLYATARVHAGWQEVGSDGRIPSDREHLDQLLGGHAFVMVGYDEEGFWLQNSWGTSWGNGGFGHVSYDDWLENGTDVWVARLGAPVRVATATSVAIGHSPKVPRSDAPSLQDLRRHIVSIGNNGELSPGGDYGTTRKDLEALVDTLIETIRPWETKRLLLYAHGGLVDEASAVQVLADLLPPLTEAKIYPVSFIWHSDFWTTMKNILDDSVSRRRPEGFLDSAKDFMLDRLDDTLEPIARLAGGKAAWDEMKENAACATTTPDGGARLFIDRLLDKAGDMDVEIHLVGHSAGSIFHAPLAQYLATPGSISSGPMTGGQGKGLTIPTCTLWAPACTMELFRGTYFPLIGNGIRLFRLFTLDDHTEQDDNCVHIYNKSLLYLVSNAFEKEQRIPVIREEGVPLLGMEKFIRREKKLLSLIKTGAAEWIRSPNSDTGKPACHATSRHHGDFDNDRATLGATLARIVGTGTTKEMKAMRTYTARKPASALRRLRRCLDGQL